MAAVGLPCCGTADLPVNTMEQRCWGGDSGREAGVEGAPMATKSTMISTVVTAETVTLQQQSVSNGNGNDGGGSDGKKWWQPLKW